MAASPGRAGSSRRSSNAALSWSVRAAVAASTSSCWTRGNSVRLPPLVASGLVTLRKNGSSSRGTVVMARGSTFPSGPASTAVTVDRSAARDDREPDELGGWHPHGPVRAEPDPGPGADDAASRDVVRAGRVEVVEPHAPGRLGLLDPLAGGREGVAGLDIDREQLGPARPGAWPPHRAPWRWCWPRSAATRGRWSLRAGAMTAVAVGRYRNAAAPPTTSGERDHGQRR